jgi:hypothetical protein
VAFGRSSEGLVRDDTVGNDMSLELQIAILGIVVAVVIGAWQIHLARQQVQTSRGTALPTGGSAMATELPANRDNLLHRLWSSFEPELQEALSVAYNQARREGKDRISTRTFFAAVARLKPRQLAQFLDRLPENALPEPIGEDVPRESTILQEEPQLSTCVENALSHLGKRADPQHKLSTAEVFVDVAKHGTGPSVAHLREQGVTPETIDQLIQELGWEVRER